MTKRKYRTRREKNKLLAEYLVPPLVEWLKVEGPLPVMTIWNTAKIHGVSIQDFRTPHPTSVGLRNHYTLIMILKTNQQHFTMHRQPSNKPILWGAK